MSNVIEFSIKAIDNFSAVMGKMHQQTSMLEKVMATAVVTAAAYTAVRMVQHSLDTAEAMGVAAEKANMAAEQFSALAWAAKMSNVEQGSLTTGLKLLERALAEGDATPAGEALTAMGVAARDATGNLRPTLDVLYDVSDAFANAKDDANKTKIALDLFGRSGLDMVPMLNQGSAAIKQMMGDAEKLGMVISGDFAKSADQVNDNLATMAAIMQGSVNKAMVEVSPVIELITGQFIELATEGDNVATAGRVMASGMLLAISVGTALVAVFSAVGTTLGGVAAAVVALATGDFKGAFEVIKATTVDLGTTIGETAAKIEMQWDGTTQSFAANAAKQASAARKLKESLAEGAEQRKKDSEERKKASAAHEAEMNKIIADLRLQSATYGMTSDQIKLYTLAIGGADEGLQREALNLINAKIAADEHAAALERAKGIIESLKTPLDEHNQKLLDINNSRALLTNDQFQQAHAAEMTAWEEKQAAVEFYGVSIRSASQMIGDAMAQSIVDGTSLAAALEQVAKTALKTIVGTLIQIGIQRLALAVLDHNVTAAGASQKMGAAMGEVYLNSFASAAAIPVVGFAIAPGAATANTAIAAAGVGTAISVGAGIGAVAGAAHGGLDYVPNESTYLLQQGERVLSPRQNEDLTGFLEGGVGAGGVTISNLTIHILENATNVDAFARMDKIELRNVLGQPVIDALDEMWRFGIQPNFAARVS